MFCRLIANKIPDFKEDFRAHCTVRKKKISVFCRLIGIIFYRSADTAVYNYIVVEVVPRKSIVGSR